DIPQWEALQAFSQLQKSPRLLAPEKHPWVRRVSEIKFAVCAVKSSRYDRRQPQRTIRYFIRQRKSVIQRRQQTSGISDILKLVQQVMDVAGHTGRRVTVAHAIRQNYAG